MIIKIFFLFSVVAMIGLSFLILDTFLKTDTDPLKFCLEHGFGEVKEARSISIYCLKVANVSVAGGRIEMVFHGIFNLRNGTWNMDSYRFEEKGKSVVI